MSRFQVFGASRRRAFGAQTSATKVASVSSWLRASMTRSPASWAGEAEAEEKQGHPLVGLQLRQRPEEFLDGLSPLGPFAGVDLLDRSPGSVLGPAPASPCRVRALRSCQVPGPVFDRNLEPAHSIDSRRPVVGTQEVEDRLLHRVLGLGLSGRMRARLPPQRPPGLDQNPFEDHPPSSGLLALGLTRHAPPPRTECATLRVLASQT